MKKYFEPSELIINDDNSVFHLHMKPEELADKVILVGDPGRVPTVAAHFEEKECDVENREFHSITGTYKEPSKAAKFFSNLGCHLVIGGELAIGKNLFLRASYNYEAHHNMSVPKKRSLVGFSAGFGVKIKMFQIDYARSRNNIVGSPNFLTVRVDLSKF